jgi:hypothetical protein
MRKETFPILDNMQNNQSFPLKVFSEDVPQQVNMEESTKLATQMGLTIADLLGGAELPKTVLARKYVHRQHFISDETLVENRASVPVRLGLQSRMRNRD